MCLLHPRGLLPRLSISNGSFPARMHHRMLRLAATALPSSMCLAVVPNSRRFVRRIFTRHAALKCPSRFRSPALIFPTPRFHTVRSLVVPPRVISTRHVGCGSLAASVHVVLFVMCSALAHVSRKNHKSVLQVPTTTVTLSSTLWFEYQPSTGSFIRFHIRNPVKRMGNRTEAQTDARVRRVAQLPGVHQLDSRRVYRSKDYCWSLCFVSLEPVHLPHAAVSAIA